jgi:hypothetical protein
LGRAEDNEHRELNGRIPGRVAILMTESLAALCRIDGMAEGEPAFRPGPGVLGGRQGDRALRRPRRNRPAADQGRDPASSMQWRLAERALRAWADRQDIRPKKLTRPDDLGVRITDLGGESAATSGPDCDFAHSHSSVARLADEGLLRQSGRGTHNPD